MNDIHANIKRRIDDEVNAIFAGKRKFMTYGEVMQICLDEVVADACAKLMEQVIAEHPELAA